MREIYCKHESQYNLRNSNDFTLLRTKTVAYMAQKPFVLEASKSGLPLRNLSKILHLLLNLKAKLNLGQERTATADCVKLLSQT